MEFEEKLVNNEFPIIKISINKNEFNSHFNNNGIDSFNELVGLFRNKLEGIKDVKIISEFDNLGHTQSIGGEINKNIINAKIIIYCFGKNLLSPEQIAIRPRNLSICEIGDYYTISFLKIPSDNLNNLVKKIILEVIKND